MSDNKKIQVLNSLKESISNLKSLDGITLIVKIILYATIIAILIFTFWYISYVLKKDSKNCKNINKEYPNGPLISSVDYNDEKYKHNLRDYYIKTAYNACSAGEYKGDFVNICALKNAIKRGARCLDFEIYSVKNKPVIAVSNIKDYNTKGVYNNVDFAEAIDVIKDYAYSGSTCPNPTDPLILHFRIMSNNKKIYDDIAKILHSNLQDKMLDNIYSYEYSKNYIGELPLSNLMNKVIIIVDATNPLFKQTTLNEYVNITTNSEPLRSYTYSQLKTVQDYTELTEYNKQKMTLIKPDLGIKPTNPSVALAQLYGCQFTAIAYQTNDSFCKLNEKLFDDNGTAFILKPENLRYKPVTIDIPPPQNKAIQSNVTGTVQEVAGGIKTIL
jgi:hypothetical protein